MHGCIFSRNTLKRMVTLRWTRFTRVAIRARASGMGGGRSRSRVRFRVRVRISVGVTGRGGGRSRVIISIRGRARIRARMRFVMRPEILAVTERDLEKPLMANPAPNSNPRGGG